MLYSYISILVFLPVCTVFSYEKNKKEMFSYDPSCSWFFICLLNIQKQSSIRQRTTRTLSVTLTDVSVSSCRGESRRESHPCRPWDSATRHPAQQRFHLLYGRIRHRTRPPLWTLSPSTDNSSELNEWIRKSTGTRSCFTGIISRPFFNIKC